MQSRRKFLALTGSTAALGALGATQPAAAWHETIADVPFLPGQRYPTMGTDSSNPTATVFGNFKCPYTQEFVLNNLSPIAQEYVSTGRMNLRFRCVAYEPNPDDPSHGSSYYYISDSDPRISEASLGVWDVDPNDYWGYYLDMFQDQVSGWVSLDELISRMDAAGVDSLGSIRDRVAADSYEQAVVDSRDAAAAADLPWTPWMKFGSYTTSPHHDIGTVTDWIEARLDEFGGGGGGGSTTSSGTGEVGTLATNQASGSEWHAVDLRDSYDSTVVLAGPLTARGGHPAHVRVDDVGSSGFQYQIEEWDYLDGAHKTEVAHYLATSAGTHRLDNGNLLEAGATGTGHQWQRVNLNADFDRTPVVLADTQTTQGGQAVNARLTGVGTGGFYVHAQESEARGWHKDERIGYAAFEPGTDRLDGQPMEANTTLTVVDDSWTRIDFERYYTEPEFVATVQTFRGGNPVDLRYRNLTGSSVEVRLQEEQSADWETNHYAEQVGYVVVDDA